MTTGQPQILNRLVLAATAKGYQQGVRDGRAGQPLIADDDNITDANIEAIEQMALDEVATLRAEFEKAKVMMRDLAEIATERQLAGERLRARVQQLEQIARDGITRYLQNGGCSNCGALPHAATCLVGQLDAALGTTPPEITRGERT
jgi:ribosomal protein L16 Arg81 hydroxylase